MTPEPNGLQTLLAWLVFLTFIGVCCWIARRYQRWQEDRHWMREQPWARRARTPRIVRRR